MRIRTVRSTWVLSILAIVFNCTLGVLASLKVEDLTRADYLQRLTFGYELTGLFMSLIGVFAFAHEYRHGTIRATLAALPRRLRVYLAKIVVVTFWTSVVTLLALALRWSITLLLIGGPARRISLTAAPGPRVLLGTVFIVVLGALIGLAYAALFRNVVAAIVLLLVVPLVVEGLVFALLTLDALKPVRAVARFLPYTASRAITAMEPVELFGTRIYPWQGAAVFAGFAALLLLPAWLLFARRDA